jgi:hypothetical protein
MHVARVSQRPRQNFLNRPARTNESSNISLVLSVSRWTLPSKSEQRAQPEVPGRHFARAALDFNGDVALSWQTLLVGPPLCDTQLARLKDVSDQLLPMLEPIRMLWRGHQAQFCADNGRGAGKYLNSIRAEGWHYTMS